MRYDVIIVGSGAAGVTAACPLVEAGLTVLMLDVGTTAPQTIPIPDLPFARLRREDSNQHRYFLGDNFEGIPVGPLTSGPQLTPPRQYLTDEAFLSPTYSPDLTPLVTLAQGGMASAWGAGSYSYNDEDLRGFPISTVDLKPHFEAVAKRIGVSAEMDDLVHFDGTLDSVLPPLHIDQNAQSVLDAYTRRKKKLNAKGLYMGKTRLAALSVPYRGRGPEHYFDMSFWSDADKSVWRPAYTLAELKMCPNFTYISRQLVVSFKEGALGVDVMVRHADSGATATFSGRTLVLAAGVFGTTRIVLHSLGKWGTRVPFVCNPYTYYPTINWRMLGSPIHEQISSLAPLCLFYTPGEGQQPLHGRVHGYRSLLSFKVIKEMPLPYREAMHVTRAILSALTIVALDHEDLPTPEKYCTLHKGSLGKPDQLEVRYALSSKVRSQQIQNEKRAIKHLRKMGCIPLKRVWPGYGGSLHYGGTFPMSREDKELTTDTEGKLRQTHAVYIADGSTFPYLPAKGLTFTMMANANRIAAGLAKELKAGALASVPIVAGQ